MDNEVLRQIYRRYQKELYLYLYSLCKNRELAEDLLQETFLKALLALPDGHNNMRAWLYMVARNLFLNYAKREKCIVEMDELVEVADKNAEGILERLLMEEQSRLLYRALQHLDRAKREVLLLQYFAGLSQKEIAVILHLTPENVRVLAYRGKRELKSYLEGKGYDIS